MLTGVATQQVVEVKNGWSWGIFDIAVGGRHSGWWLSDRDRFSDILWKLHLMATVPLPIVMLEIQMSRPELMRCIGTEGDAADAARAQFKASATLTAAGSRVWRAFGQDHSYVEVTETVREVLRESSTVLASHAANLAKASWAEDSEMSAGLDSPPVIGLERPMTLHQHTNSLVSAVQTAISSGSWR